MSQKMYIIGFLFYYIFFVELFAKDTLIVSIPPQKFFIEQLAKDNFIVKSMLDEDSLLPVNIPSSAQYVWTEDAIGYFKIGLYDERKWLKKIKIKNHKIKVYDTTKGIKKYLIPYDVNTWLDPMLAKIEIRNILDILVQIDPKNEQFYRKNYFKFMNKISSLDYQLKTLFKHKRKNTFIVFQPVWGYLAKRYNLTQYKIDADTFSTNKDNIIDILNQVTKYPSNIVLVPKYYFPKEIIKQIKTTNSSKVIVPISQLEYNWIDNLLNLAKIIAYTSK